VLRPRRHPPGQPVRTQHTRVLTVFLPRPRVACVTPETVKEPTVLPIDRGHHSDDRGQAPIDGNKGSTPNRLSGATWS
jgi:hypothetical protein